MSLIFAEDIRSGLSFVNPLCKQNVSFFLSIFMNSKTKNIIHVFIGKLRDNLRTDMVHTSQAHTKH